MIKFKTSQMEGSAYSWCSLYFIYEPLPLEKDCSALSLFSLGTDVLHAGPWYLNALLQCSIDLKKNVLEIGTTGSQTAFLPEGELPECARLAYGAGREDVRPEEIADQELAEAIQKSVEEAGIVMNPDEILICLVFLLCIRLPVDSHWKIPSPFLSF